MVGHDAVNEEGCSRPPQHVNEFAGVWSSSAGDGHSPLLAWAFFLARKTSCASGESTPSTPRQETRRIDTAWLEADRLKSLSHQEATIQAKLAQVTANELKELSTPGTDAYNKQEQLAKRLIKTGFEDGGLVTHETLAKMTSLIKGNHPFLNSENWYVSHRRAMRNKRPDAVQGISARLLICLLARR